jgi:hypothetical protein
MGYDFIGHGGFGLHILDWRPCFNLALAFGWQPLGTVAPCDWTGPKPWSGTYFTNELQEVCDDDAHALAAALRRALAARIERQHLTNEQKEAWANKDITVRIVRDLADYAEDGHFAIA